MSLTKIDVAKIVCQRHVYHLGHGACHLHSYRSTAHQNKREQRPDRVNVPLAEGSQALSRLKSAQDASADDIGIVERLE